MNSLKTYGTIGLIERLAIKISNLFKRDYRAYGWSFTKQWKKENKHLFL